MTADEFRRVLAALGMSNEDLRRLANEVRSDGRTMPSSSVCNMAAGRSAVGAWCELALHLLCRDRGIDMRSLLDAPTASAPVRLSREDARARTLAAMRQLLHGDQS